MEYTWEILGIVLNQTAVTIIFYGLAALFLGITAYLVYTYKKYKLLYFKDSNVLFALCIVFIVVTGIFACQPLRFVINEKQYEKDVLSESIQNALEKDYDIYINGTLVDAATIDINAYKQITIDDANKVIIITVN